jgi:hypothetical protein
MSDAILCLLTKLKTASFYIIRHVLFINHFIIHLYIV